MKSEIYENVKMPKLGLGTWQLKDSACQDAVSYALENTPCRHIDTAQIYGNEAQVGAAIEKSSVARDDIFLTTKIWMENFHADDVIASIEKSLEKLKTDYCDLILVHWPHDEIPFDETLGALSKAKEQGKTRLIGISNFTTDQVKKVREDLGFDVAVNQCEYHPFLDQSALIEQARKYGMIFTAYSPIAQGKVKSNDTLKGIAKKYDKSPVQVTLRWLYQQDRVVAIPRSSSKGHIQSNFDILNFELTDQEMSEISALRNKEMRIVDPDFAPEWDVAA